MTLQQPIAVVYYETRSSRLALYISKIYNALPGPDFFAVPRSSRRK